MIDNSTHSDQNPAPTGSFEDSEVLRAALVRLHELGRRAWRDDPQATALMEHAARKYAPLAKKHGLDPWEAASAAFVAMRGAATRNADDPWAVVTRAVQITCTAEERGQGLLCSTHQARRPRYSKFHDPERFSDRENPLTDYHPAFTTPAFTDLYDTEDMTEASPTEPTTDVRLAVDYTVKLFVLLGWDQDTALTAIDYVTTRLAQLPSRTSAYEVLRREHQAHAMIDVPAASWNALLRIVLGNPDPALSATATGHGVLTRLLCGEPLPSLLTDEDLVQAVLDAKPDARARR